MTDAETLARAFMFSCHPVTQPVQNINVLSPAVKTPRSHVRTIRRMASNIEKPMIAVVDDDLSVCRAMKRLLLAHGLRAETFTSGHVFIDVLEALPSFRPRCVVLDMQMPGLDGLEIQRRLAVLRPGVPVVFVASLAAPGHYKQALAAGAAAFFHKPFGEEIDVFVTTLRAILKMEPES